MNAIDEMQHTEPLRIIRCKTLAQAIELEQEKVIVAVKCMKCNSMISAYGFSEHDCKGESK